jgi:hypothetical protein
MGKENHNWIFHAEHELHAMLTDTKIMYITSLIIVSSKTLPCKGMISVYIYPPPNPFQQPQLENTRP